MIKKNTYSIARNKLSVLALILLLWQRSELFGFLSFLGKGELLKDIVMMICLNSDLSSDQKNNIEKSRMCDNL